MTAHTVDIQTQFETVGGEPTDRVRYRWRCTCKTVARRWHDSLDGGAGEAARRARNGGARHVAAMERAK